MLQPPRLLLLIVSCLLVLEPLAKAGNGTPTPLDKAWTKIEPHGPDLAVREIMDFVLEAAGSPNYEQYSTQIESALALLEQKQDLDPASKTYGNFCWYWHEEKPGDLNAVEFIAQKGALVQLRFAKSLSPAALASLNRLLSQSVEGIHRQSVNVGYTNIFLMKTWNLLALGEGLQRPELVQEGSAMLDQWIEFTSKNGIREFLSPTYLAVDLDSLGLMANVLSNPPVKEKAERLLRLFWTTIAANWFEPAGRLGGSHGRDYDYLTGHGYLDQYLLPAGWIDAKQASMSPYILVFNKMARWTPPEELHTQAISAVPRFVFQRWDAAPACWASQYIGHHFSIGVSGSCQGPEDKPFALNLAGPAGPKTVMVNFFMDGRGDPYGNVKTATGSSGHKKSHHLIPLFCAVQSGPEVLFLASHATGPNARKTESPLVCLLSHMDIPAEAEVWTGDHVTAADQPSQPLAGNICFLRMGDVAVGIHFVVALDTAGQPVTAQVFNDGAAYNARRLTVMHSGGVPENGRGTLAVRVRVMEGLDDAGFATFRRSFSETATSAITEGTTLRVRATGLKGPLMLEADLAKGQLVRSEGGDPAMQVDPMSVNGKEYFSGLVQKNAAAGF